MNAFLPDECETYQSILLSTKDELLRRGPTAEVLRYGQAAQAVTRVVEIM